jgi:AraC-like DNA-binding protein
MAFADSLAHHRSGYFENFATRVQREDPTDHLLIWVLEGGLTGRAGDRDLVARRGDLVGLVPGVSHSYEAPAVGDWKWLWVHFGGDAADELFARLFPRFPVEERMARLGHDDVLYARFLAMVAVGNRAQTPGSTARLTGELWSVAGLLLDLTERDESLGGSPAQLLGLTSWIAANLAQPIDLTTLCERSGYSSAQLSRLFRATTGESPMAYVTRLRIETASWLLLETQLSVTEVARAVGFGDLYHFSRRFRQLRGISPSRFRAHGKV